MADPMPAHGRGVRPVSPSECRSARALAGWSVDKLAVLAGVATPTVVNFETEARKPRPGTVIRLRRAFRAAGVDVDEAAPPSRSSPASR